MTGDLIGTLRYMSPEQALAQRVGVDHRTDIYSLGATLYELLTLEPVFDGRDRQELLRQIAFEEPRQPRRLHKAIPPELETIVLKAMAKNLAERYATAQELAEDLERYLKDEPIRARRATLVTKVKKWSRRHKSLMWSAGVSAAALLVLAVIVLLISNAWIRQEKDAKDQALGDKNDALAASRASEHSARTQEGLAKEQRGIAVHQQRIAKEQELLARRRYHAAQMNLAMQAWEVGNPVQCWSCWKANGPSSAADDLRSFEWYHMWRRRHSACKLNLPAPDTHAWCVAFSPDGKTMASGYWNAEVKLWDVASGRARATLRGHHGAVGSLAFSPNGKYLGFRELCPGGELEGVGRGGRQGTNFAQTATGPNPVLGFCP